VPLVEALTDAVDGDAARQVHRGATSQDILDTAAMVVARRARKAILDDLGGAAAAAAELARRHRDTPMAGRTLLQQAVPITFGLKAAGWLEGVGEARADLAAVVLPAQLGGAAGTLASLGEAGPAVLAAYAQELGLAEPPLAWHANRVAPARLASALGIASGAVAKVAQDVVLLAQTEVGEVAEAASGGSSTMPHKRNPVAAVNALASARQAPGLAATLLGAMAHEHERAAGAWQAEWPALSALLATAGSAAAWARACLEGLEVDPDRMRANLELTGGALMAERVVAVLAAERGRLEAHREVEAVLRRGGDLREIAADELLDPAGYLGSAGAFVDRALAAYEAQAH
jgi:3-carboxy-cis,cis-muconate cycloisomerase